MQELAREARAQGQRVLFGENYVREVREKKTALDLIPEKYDELQLQGPLQSNKVREAVALFDLIQSVHSLKVLTLIASEAARIGKRQRIMLQVNISNDLAKSGFTEETVVEGITSASQHAESIALEGLMTITAFYEDPEGARGDFLRMNKLRQRLIEAGFAQHFAHSSIKLSMGMSADFSIAIEEGADLVRVGTALFGERSVATALPVSQSHGSDIE
jgi:pyridoxal phosphate enzyme (YggS family)